MIDYLTRHKYNVVPRYYTVLLGGNRNARYIEMHGRYIEALPSPEYELGSSKIKYIALSST